MKTLDEVIASLKICVTNYCSNSEYGDCPYMDDKYNCNIRQRNADALYYLNTIYTTENLYHDAINELNAIKDEDWKDRNFSLTWDELKSMEGKPVWIEWISGTWKGLRKWVISHGCDDLMMVFTALDVAGVSYNGHLRQMNLGKTWQAYRKERV